MHIDTPELAKLDKDLLVVGLYVCVTLSGSFLHLYPVGQVGQSDTLGITLQCMPTRKVHVHEHGGVIDSSFSFPFDFTGYLSSALSSSGP